MLSLQDQYNKTTVN